MPLQDVTVTIDVVKPTEYVGLGKPLIIAKKAGLTAPTIKDYGTLAEVAADFADGTPAHEKAEALFAQEYRPKKISIAAFDAAALEGSNTYAEVAADYYDRDWFFLLTAGATATEMIAVADLVETKRYKMHVALVTAAADRPTFKAKAYERTIMFYHTVAGENPDAALIGQLGNQTVGSITWKFKTLKGITPIEVSPSGLTTIHDEGAIAYVTKAGKNETSEGFVVSGEYIDIMHGKDWIKVNMESELQKALSNAGKVPYNNNGIALFEDAAVTVLERGAAQGIIDKDDAGNPLYTVSTLDRSEVSLTDRAARTYNGLTFGYEAEGAIHDGAITGTIYTAV